MRRLVMQSGEENKRHLPLKTVVTGCIKNTPRVDKHIIIILFVAAVDFQPQLVEMVSN
jgi:hypothetical protein